VFCSFALCVSVCVISMCFQVLVCVCVCLCVSGVSARLCSGSLGATFANGLWILFVIDLCYKNLIDSCF
jgi:hypothetical protein